MLITNILFFVLAGFSIFLALYGLIIGASFGYVILTSESPIWAKALAVGFAGLVIYNTVILVMGII